MKILIIEIINTITEISINNADINFIFGLFEITIIYRQNNKITMKSIEIIPKIKALPNFIINSLKKDMVTSKVPIIIKNKVIFLILLLKVMLFSNIEKIIIKNPSIAKIKVKSSINNSEF